MPKVAVVGCGHWGRNLVRNYHRLGALGAVVDRCLKKRKAERMGSARELLAELEALVVEAAAWAELEGDERALRAVEACRRQLASVM
jgi:predicted dehydrogenase